MIWSDPAVQSAIISSAGSILAALIAAIAAAVIGRQFANRKELQAKLMLAQHDVAFLLGVEEEYGNLHKELAGSSQKLTIRQNVRNRGLTWSGKNTPGRVNFATVQEFQ